MNAINKEGLEFLALCKSPCSDYCLDCLACGGRMVESHCQGAPALGSKGVVTRPRNVPGGSAMQAKRSTPLALVRAPSLYRSRWLLV